MVANHSPCWSRAHHAVHHGQRGRSGQVGEPRDHRLGVDHEGHDMDHHDHVGGVGRVRQGGLEGEPNRSSRASASRSIGLATDASGRQLLAQHVGHGRRQARSSPSRPARSAQSTPGPPELDRMSARGPRPWGKRPNALAATSSRRRLSTRMMPQAARRRRSRHRRWRPAPVGRWRPGRRSRSGLREERDHRAWWPTPAGATWAEALMVLDRLDIEQWGTDLGPVAQPAQIVFHAEMDGIADRDDRDERQAAGVGLVDEPSASAPDWR